MKCKLYSEITVEIWTQLKNVKITSNIFAVYPEGKIDISQDLATPGSPRVTIQSASPVRMMVHCVVKHSRSPQMSASHLLGLQVRANRPSYHKFVLGIDSVTN